MRHYLDETKKQFLGKTIQSLRRLEEDAALVEFSDGTQLRITVEGDCCSHSIFYEIVFPENLIGAILEDVVEREWDEDSSLSKTTADSEAVALEKVKAAGFNFYPEENNVWNVVLKTNRGLALLRHINSSNGYYDGHTNYEVIRQPHAPSA